MILPSLMLAALASCAISEAKTYADVDVQLASVTLADDCGGAPPPPPAQPPQGGFAKPPPGDVSRSERPRPAQGSCAKPGPCGPTQRNVCEPTSMQLSLTSKSASPTTIKIKRVELLDKSGRVLEVLGSGTPTQWATKGYVQWDETIAPNGTVKVSYRLNAPNWAKLTGGRMNAHTHTFQLRVTVTVGNADRTVEKTQITPARIAPMVVT